MTLTLSQHDQTRVAAATRALVSPLVSPSLEDWLRDVNQAVKSLMGADRASMLFPLGQVGFRAESEGYSSPMLEDYVQEKLPDIERRWGIQRRSVELGAFDRQLAYGDKLREIYRSEYYNEYLIPNRAFDVVGLAVAADSPTRAVILYLHHDQPRGRRFGPRGLALARMLYPAFKAGVQASTTLFSSRHRLLNTVDVMAAGIALADSAGRIVHRNPALVRLLQFDADRLAIEARISAAARACVTATWGSTGMGANASRGARVPGRLSTKVSVSSGVYAICASTLSLAPHPHEAAIAVTVERSAQAAFPGATLRKRFGLTERELDVARLLGEGASNEEVARSLAISAATARHHTEAVMLKLGVHSRARIPALLSTLLAG